MSSSPVKGATLKQDSRETQTPKASTYTAVEVIGRIEALGSGVSRWKIGQRVGGGLIAGEDGVCEPCRRGDPVNCQNPVVSGVTADRGYAEVMIAEARGIPSVPDEFGSAEAAPLLCAGVTTYNALRNAGLRAGDLVAVQGVGGLGPPSAGRRDHRSLVLRLAHSFEQATDWCRRSLGLKYENA